MAVSLNDLPQRVRERVAKKMLKRKIMRERHGILIKEV